MPLSNGVRQVYLKLGIMYGRTAVYGRSGREGQTVRIDCVAGLGGRRSVYGGSTAVYGWCTDGVRRYVQQGGRIEAPPAV